MGKRRPDKTILLGVTKVPDDKEVQADWKGRVVPGSAAFNWLTEIRLDDVVGSNEYERGMREGTRNLARVIQDMILGEFDAAES